MKNLNIYGDKSKEIIISEGRLENINDFHQISYISIKHKGLAKIFNEHFLDRWAKGKDYDLSY